MYSPTVSNTNANINAATVRLFSPTDQLPDALSRMSTDELWAHIHQARRVMELHESNARGGIEGAARWYFFIPEVARDMANARYTLTIMFTEIARRKNAERVYSEANLPPGEPFANNPHWQSVKKLIDADRAREQELVSKGATLPRRLEQHP